MGWPFCSGGSANINILLTLIISNCHLHMKPLASELARDHYRVILSCPMPFSFMYMSFFISWLWMVEHCYCTELLECHVLQKSDPAWTWWLWRMLIEQCHLQGIRCTCRHQLPQVHTVQLEMDHKSWYGKNDRPAKIDTYERDCKHSWVRFWLLANSFASTQEYMYACNILRYDTRKFLLACKQCITHMYPHTRSCLIPACDMQGNF